PGDGCTLDVLPDPRDEALTVVRRVREALAQGSTDVAILVRARAHLDEILPALRDAGVPFTAVELDKLGQRQAVLDLVSLTHALLQPADRLAWLAVLRAPWCGLAFADLLAIAEAAPPPVPLRQVLGDASVLARLSDDGRLRVARVRDVLGAAFAAHGRAGLVPRIRGAWLALGGPACLADPLDLETAERYFDVLAAHERAGDVPDWGAFRAALDELHASPEPEADARVQVMTMHKAKGLQFDTVILPGLGRRGLGPSPELLRWRSRDRGLLIAPSKSPGGEADPVYEYLTRLEKEESQAELGRLLYVACTRAQARLHLVAALPAAEDKAGELGWRVPSTSSLARLWPVLGGDAPPATAAAAVAPGRAHAPPLVRLPRDHVPARPERGLHPLDAAEAAREDVAFDWAQERARVIGTLAHRLLARRGGGEAWDAERVERLVPRVRADLASAGFGDDELAGATQRVLDVVRRTLADERDRWIFDPAHTEARSEWGIAGVDHDAVVHLVVDRTFVAGGERWIVDFKTGTHEGGDAEGFLASEALRYRDQLQRYGRLMRALDPRPVRLALYYPLVDGGFREIPPA
ncbi:MAG TPA: 3'-5' exonuclease, partial [Casimicrobiaceae bacterium]|nr:3'-5' exonuclease [Casimicrobiaceae bacterium]